MRSWLSPAASFLLALASAAPATAQNPVLARLRIDHVVDSFHQTIDRNDLFGASVVSLGDLDGDELSDVLVGAPAEGNSAGQILGRGAAFVLFRSPGGGIRSFVEISRGEGGLS